MGSDVPSVITKANLALGEVRRVTFGLHTAPHVDGNPL